VRRRGADIVKCPIPEQQDQHVYYDFLSIEETWLLFGFREMSAADQARFVEKVHHAADLEHRRSEVIHGTARRL
jgi:hypothetical protein